MPLPLVSVVLPTFNREDLVVEACESVLRQSYSHIELLVVDDGSTDGTIARLSEIRDDRLEVVPQPHVGVTGTLRNLGITKARGEWVAFQDSDDLWHPRKLEMQLDALREAPASRWCFTGFAIVDENSRPLANPLATASTDPSSQDLYKQLLTYDRAAPIPSLMVEKQLLEEVGGLDPELSHDDVDLVLRLAVAAPGEFVPQALLTIRKDSTRPWTARESLIHQQQMDAILIKHLRQVSDLSKRTLCRGQRCFHQYAIARARTRLGSYRAAASAAMLAFLMAPHRLYLLAYRRLQRQADNRR